MLLPKLLQHDLGAGEVLDQVHLPVGDHDLGLTGDDRLDEIGDALLRVLVVTVGVDHDVGAQFECALHAVVEGAAQSPVACMAHEVGDAHRPRDLDGAVGRTVVDDQHDDLVDARDRCGDRLENQREGLLLVEARNLNN